MSHMVIYRSAEGKPGYHQTEELDDAVSYVEALRNQEGVEHARIFRLEEVTFDFKPYFKVEIGGAGAAPAAPSIAPAPVVAPPPIPEPPTTVPPPPPAPPAGDGAPVAESSTLAPPAPPAPPEAPETTDDDSNGVGARRGLFGR